MTMWPVSTPVFSFSSLIRSAVVWDNMAATAARISPALGFPSKRRSIKGCSGAHTMKVTP